LDREAWDDKYREVAPADSVQRVRATAKSKIGKILCELLAPYSLILESGSGTGRILNYVALATRARGCGVDFSSEGNRLARQTARALGVCCTFVSGDLTALPFASATFDLVFSDSVIEHLEHPFQAVAEMARVAKPGGAVVVTTPNRLRPDGWDLYRVRRRLPYRQRSFTPWHLKSLFRRAGLDVQRFFGDTLVLLRNFRTLERTVRTATKAVAPQQSTGLYQHVEQLAERFVPPYLWVNIGVIGVKRWEGDGETARDA
jgi:ubiquinone/menaquinone biosynthesis C-methylase UbiE